jgi:hypothetical protein
MEIVTYWEAIRGTLAQRGLLRPNAGDPCAVAIVEPDRVAFILDMQRLGGVSRENWLNQDLWEQWRAALQGRRAIVADKGGLAVVVARRPGEVGANRLPQSVSLKPGDVPPGDYKAVLGVARSGPVVLDLARADRSLLVGGTSGSGKSKALQSLALQLAQKHGPDKVRLAVVDLKALDFPLLGGLPQLVGPVATSYKGAADLVQWVDCERQRRGEVLAAARVSRWDNIPLANRFPLLVLLIDECADFAGKDGITRQIVEIARKGRAVGLSLIMGTQRPSADILTGQIRANLSTRVALRCTTQTESRIILDAGGAEKFTRPGLALTNAGGRGLVKVQCGYIPDGELGDWVGTALTAGPALSSLEAEMVAFALAMNGGRFTVGDLATAFQGRMSRRKIAELAQRWEQRGWLTIPANAVDARRVTPQLSDLARAATVPGPALAGKDGNTVTGGTGGNTALETVTGVVIGAV